MQDERQPLSEAARAAAAAWASRKTDTEPQSDSAPSGLAQPEQPDYSIAKRRQEGHDASAHHLSNSKSLFENPTSNIDNVSSDGRKRKRALSTVSLTEGASTEMTEALSHLQQFGTEVLSRTCHLCDNPLIPNLDVAGYLESRMAMREVISAHNTGFVSGLVPAIVDCPAGCGASTCIGCGSANTGRKQGVLLSEKSCSTQDECIATTALPSSNASDPSNITDRRASLRSRAKKAEKAVAKDLAKLTGDRLDTTMPLCCTQGWIAAIWMLLCYFDRTNRQYEELAAQKSLAWIKSSKKSKGIGYSDGGHDYYYDDYDSDNEWDNHPGPQQSYGPGKRLGTADEDRRDEPKQGTNEKIHISVKQKPEE